MHTVNKQKKKTFLTPLTWIDKQGRVCTYNEWNNVHTVNIEKETNCDMLQHGWTESTKSTGRHQGENTVWFALYKVLRTVKFTDTEKAELALPFEEWEWGIVLFRQDLLY